MRTQRPLSLQQIVEEPTTPTALTPRSPTASFQDSRKAFNFSRPRPTTPASLPHTSASTVTASPTITQSPVIDHQFRPQFHGYQPYAQNRARDQDDNISLDDDDAAPPPVIRTFSDHFQAPRNAKQNQPKTLVYKPYADSIASSRHSSDDDASSFMTNDTDDTITTNDTDSIAETESIAESTTSDINSAPDFSFDDSLGWTTQRTYHAERERQRLVAPVIVPRGTGASQSRGTDTRQISTQQPLQPERLHINRPQQAKADNAAWHNWYSNGGNDALVTPNEPPRRNPLRDVIATDTVHNMAQEAVKEALPQHLDRTTSGGTQRSSGSKDSSSSNRSRILHKTLEAEKPGSRGSDLDSMRASNGGSGNSTSSINSVDWNASNVDLSTMSPAKIEKLKKKGINPQLYMEMRQAKKGAGKGRSLVGVLTGNSLLS